MRIAALQRRPTIIVVETDHYIADQAKKQLRRAAWREQHANHPTDNNIEVIDLIHETEGSLTPECTEQIESSHPTAYTIKVTQLFTG